MNAHVSRELFFGRKVIVAKLPGQSPPSVDQTGEKAPQRQPDQRQAKRPPKHHQGADHPQGVLAHAKLGHMHLVKITRPPMYGGEIQQEWDDQHDGDAGGIVGSDLFGDKVYQRRLQHHGR